MKANGVSVFSMLVVSLLALLCLQDRKSPDTYAQASPDNKDQLKLPLTNPKIIVFKSKRRLELYSNDRMVRAYRIGLGTNPVDDKVRQGDRRTPEGQFYICIKNPKSRYYLSLGLSYPNEEDAGRGLRDGLINRNIYNQIVRAIRAKRTPAQNTALGGEIFIHGHGSGSDWTWGCVALDNEDMKELFDAVTVGTTVVIKP
jgi:murein L,D-transpeptidase YafK